MLNKPRGYICATKDEFFQTVLDLFQNNERSGLFPIGRLDIDTEGLLLVTDDGDLSFRLTRPEFAFEKRYFFMAFGELTSEKAKSVEKSGELFGNGKERKPARIENLRYKAVVDCADYIPKEKLAHAMKNKDGRVSLGEITVTEGKKHEVKLILKGLGCSIFYLKRLSVGEITLDESLKTGEYRPLNSDELALVNEYRKKWIEL